MNTPDTSGAEVKPTSAPEFSEAAVATWMNAQIATFDTRGMVRASLHISSDKNEHRCAARAYGEAYPAGSYGFGETFAEAFAKLRAEVPVNSAENLRAKADRLRSLADDMDAQHSEAKS